MPIDPAGQSGPRRVRGTLRLLGPAFVAAIAYVDPGNVAANLSGGSKFGYTLLWVLVVASAMAVLVQYRSAKLGIVTGRSLTSLVGERLRARRHGNLLTWLYGGQAFLIAVATDIAEVVGGALGMYLLFGTPLWLGGVLVGVLALGLLWVLRRRGEHFFELAIAAVGLLIAVAFLGGLFWAPPDAAAMGRGLVPVIPDGSLPLIAAMLGATVMPHAIYLHSSLTVDRYASVPASATRVPVLLRVQRWDVGLALATSGVVNIAMLLFGAAALPGIGGDSIEIAHAMLQQHLGSWPAAFLAVGLLASGLGSTVVGTHAGARILRDLVPVPVPPWLRRGLTVVPAVALLSTQLHPTDVLVASQLVLSFGIAFAAAPLVWLTGNRDVMGEWVDTRWDKVIGWAVVGAIVVLNVVLIVQMGR